ncbi:MAG: UDP-N-acetylmuramate dehydrogenase [Myxococcales bacterium]|nr:UDP-N-acetylmuramate dehydrogenase [Myxococcales bacterium]
MTGSRLHTRLAELFGERCAFGVPMAPLTTWQVGGPADCLLRPVTAEEIAEVVRLCTAENETFRVFGACSNLLILDGGLRGVTLLMRQGFEKFEPEFRDGGEVVLTVGAALLSQTVVDRSAAAGIDGLQFISGVPGTIGGGIRMNAGTYLGDFSQVLREITVVDADGKIRRVPRDKLVYRYRGLVLDGSFVVTEAKLELRRGEAAKIRAEVDAIIASRHSRHPWDLPSGGSTFKNPENDHAGRLIEAAGLKGFQIGGARVSEKHANFLVNVGQAKAADILALIEHVRQTVYDRFGIWLDPEVKILGERDVQG